MFDLPHYENFEIILYKTIRDDISSKLTHISTRKFSSTEIEELYRFGDTKFYLEIFYEVPPEWELIKSRQNQTKFDSSRFTTVKFGIFNDETNEAIPLDTALGKLPKQYRDLICFNLDHFSNMMDIFERK